MTRHRRKLIEVALPLEAINEEGSRRKRKAPAGYPTTLHKWWAQRPLAAARAVIFSQMVDDPSEYAEELLANDAGFRRRAKKELEKRLAAWLALGTGEAERGAEPALLEVAADLERQRLFRLIEELVKWENTTNEAVLQPAREEIWKSWRRTCAENADHPRAAELFDRKKLPAFHDPFAGGGSLPLEAQRLGLEAHASDLNPVAVLINKAMIEIPPRFAGRPPVNPEWQAKSPEEKALRTWKGAEGLAEDVRYYGKWMRDEAERRIGHLYPRIEITPEMVKERPDLKRYDGKQLTVVAWLWVRTVKSPNPAFANVDIPLASTFMLSTKEGKEAYVEPVIENIDFRFTVKVGKPKDAEGAKSGTKLSQGAFKCLMSGSPFKYEYIDNEANAGRMGERLMAIVAEGQRGRVYLSPSPEHESIARTAEPTWKPETPSRGTWASNAQGRRYGFRTFGDYFTPRQLLALTTFCDLVDEAKNEIVRDAATIGPIDDGPALREGGAGTQAYAEAVAVYLVMAISRVADYGSSLATWRPKDGAMRSAMPIQAIQMAWDFAEASAFGKSSAGFVECVGIVASAMERAFAIGEGRATQDSAQGATLAGGCAPVVSTDPPYYVNVGYSDLSDFFYVWIRRALRAIYPELCATFAVPKEEELVATPYRHGSKEKAEAFFLDGMTQAMRRLVEQAHPAFPVTIYYALKQAETDSDAGTASTGWETFLDAVIRSGFSLVGTWPMRTEGDNRQVSLGANALASSIVLVCRQRAADASPTTRGDFARALRAELPRALAELQHGNIAPVDLAQAAIGPGMAVFTRYAQVLDAEGRPLSVREALALINQVLDEALAEQEGDFDADSRWALAWFEQYGFEAAEYGVAETLSKAKNTSVEGMAGKTGILESKAGKVRLKRPAELDPNWDPATDPRVAAWEIVHHLVRRLDDGEAAAADLVARLGARAEVARELAYRLYNLCERKKRAPEALSYNALVQSWPEVVKIARVNQPETEAQQAELFRGGE